MAEYTPSENRVRLDYQDAYPRLPAETTRAEFDRFLARVRRDAAREALDGLVIDLQDLHEVAMYSGIRANALLGANRAAIYRDTHYPEETPDAD